MSFKSIQMSYKLGRRGQRYKSLLQARGRFKSGVPERITLRKYKRDVFSGWFKLMDSGGIAVKYCKSGDGKLIEKCTSISVKCKRKRVKT